MAFGLYCRLSYARVNEVFLFPSRINRLIIRVIGAANRVENMLEGVRIVEMATYIAAPSAGGMMADWGAEVIKIEAREGDPIRHFFKSIGADLDGNPVFDLDNRGKRSVAIDFSTPDGAEAIHRLLEDADVFLTNLRPGSLKRAGLDWDTLHARHSKLIYATVTGYGIEGPEADRPGFDMAAFWSRAGVGQLFAPKGEDPVPLRTAFGDHVTGQATVAGICAALVERARTDKGRLVETSLLRTGIYSLGSDMAIQLKFGRLASTKSREQAPNPVNNFFKTRDGFWLCLMPRQSGKDWPDICRALGHEEWLEGDKFTSPKARRKNGPELVGLLDQAFGTRTLEDWHARLDEAHLVWAPVQTPKQVVEDPQAEAAGAFVEMPDHSGGTFRSPASPVRFHGADDGPKGPSPLVGQHTDEVLAEVGYTPEEIAKLKENEIVGPISEDGSNASKPV